MKNAALVFLFIQLFFSSCNNNPVAPSENIQPGRRDYVWTVDTIPVVNSVMRDMYASSPTNVWICGDVDNRKESVIHYDGANFEPSGVYILNPTCIWGSSPNDIWLGTAVSELWHYNGSSWSKFKTLTQAGYNDVIIQSLCGNSVNDIYASGMANGIDDYKGIILHYNGIDWDFISIPYTRVNFYEIDLEGKTNNYFLEAANFDQTGTPERLYKLSDNILQEIYASESGTYLGYLNKQIFMYNSDDKKIYSYSNGNFELFKDFETTIYKWGIWGRSEKDFFCITSEDDFVQSGIGHYNGSDLATLFYTNFRIVKTIIFNEGIIFLGFDVDDFTQVIIKGELK